MTPETMKSKLPENSVRLLKMSMTVCFSLSTLFQPLSATEIPRSGTVFIYMPSTYLVTGGSATLKVDGLTVAEIASCKYAKLRLPEGVHRYEVAWSGGWFERSPVSKPIEIILPMIDGGKYYLGFFPHSLNQKELLDTFTYFKTESHSEQVPGRDRVSTKSIYFGSVKPEIATAAMYRCSEVKALTDVLND